MLCSKCKKEIPQKEDLIQPKNKEELGMSWFKFWIYFRFPFGIITYIRVIWFFLWRIRFTKYFYIFIIFI